MLKNVLKTLIILFILTGIGLYANYFTTGKLPVLERAKAGIFDLNISKISESATDLFDLNKEKATTKQNTCINSVIRKA